MILEDNGIRWTVECPVREKGHLMSSYQRDNERPGWVYPICSWCGQGQPLDSVMREYRDARR